MSFEPGTLVSPTLRLVKKLGEGGMGSVWVADHLTLRTQVAVKFVSADVARMPEAMQRFSQEASTAAQLRHPHAVQILDHGTSRQGLPFIVMELLEGQDLASLIRAHGRFDLEATTRFVAQVCKVLAKAHSIGLVHRDIKPENIFVMDVDGEPFVKVLDFGIAKRTDSDQRSITATNATVGTPHYMSPEQALSPREVGASADLWSLAVVAYACLTGTVPFDGNTVPAVFVSVAKGEFQLPSAIIDGIPPALDDWFTRALNHDPEARFSSARQMAETFAAATGVEQTRVFIPSIPVPLSGGTSSAADVAATQVQPMRVTGMEATLTQDPGRNGRWTALIALAVVLAAVGSVAFWKGRWTQRTVGAPTQGAGIPLTTVSASASAAIEPTASSSSFSFVADAGPVQDIPAALTASKEGKKSSGKRPQWGNRPPASPKQSGATAPSATPPPDDKGTDYGI